MISLELMSEENSIDIYSFEKENREYFERSLPPRPAHYFDSESFKEITRELLREQENHDVYMHLIRDAQGVMVGRINLSVLEKAFTTYGLHKIIAGTATDNLASQRVLLKNGFTFSKIIENDFQMNNEWIHTAVFEIRNL